MSDHQLTDADLAGMSPQQIVDARAAGRLDRLLGVPEAHIDVRTRARNGEVLDRADCARLNRIGNAELVAQAAAEGRIIDRTTTEEN